jgi:hypothetical protein
MRDTRWLIKSTNTIRLILIHHRQNPTKIIYERWSSQEAEEDCITKYYYSNEVKENIGMVFSMHGRDEKYIQKFDWKTWREETTQKTYT